MENTAESSSAATLFVLSVAGKGVALVGDCVMLTVAGGGALDPHPTAANASTNGTNRIGTCRFMAGIHRPGPCGSDH